MKDQWSYDKTKYFDKNGQRWHFVRRRFFPQKDGEDEPSEIYFRNDLDTEFGVLRFERLQDNPYRDYKTIVNKIINNKPFRTSLLNPETETVWRKKWK